MKVTDEDRLVYFSDSDNGGNCWKQWHTYSQLGVSIFGYGLVHMVTLAISLAF